MRIRNYIQSKVNGLGSGRCSKWRERNLERHTGVRVKGLLLLRTWTSGLEACEQKAPGREGRWVVHINIPSPQFSCGLVQIMRQAVVGVGGSPAWSLPIWHV